jgi:hypothetical protein
MHPSCKASEAVCDEKRRFIGPFRRKDDAFLQQFPDHNRSRGWNGWLHRSLPVQFSMSGDPMVFLSKAAQETIWGDAAILRYLEMAREHFEIGERSALFEAPCLCARFQAVIPKWAADALLDAQRSLEHGETKDFNEAFGWDGESQAVRERSSRPARIEKDVLVELQNARLDGASPAPDDIFDMVCESFVCGVCKSAVETLKPFIGIAGSS